MKIFQLITLLLISALAQAQIVDIPDANFKQALIINGVDTNNDGEIQVSEAEATINLYVQNANIDSLEGIQSFTNLVLLNCGSNNLSSIDFTQNTNLNFLICTFNQLTSLDFTHNPNLEHIHCSYNQLTSLDVTQNPDLNFLDCGYNLLTSLDVSQNPNLNHLTIKENSISSIDVSQNPNLEWFSCSQNQLTNLDVTQNPNLEYLYCRFNQITSLDVSQNSNIIVLDCYDNQLTNLDITQIPNLERLSCGDNLLIHLNINNGNNHNMTEMFAFNNPNLNCIKVDDETATYPICDFVNVSGWCKDEWAEYSEGCELGVTDIDSFNIKVHPNPVQNTLNINSELPIDYIKIYTLQGKLIKETSKNQIDLSLLSSGLYFVSIMIDGENIVKKFIKN